MPKIILSIISILVIVAFLIIIISFIANYQFNQNVQKEIRESFSDVKSENDNIQEAELTGLPLPVQKWLENSQVVGKKRINSVRLKQKAVMRTKKNGPWMPVEAEQYFTINKPGFIWKAKIKAAPFVHIVGRDKYYEGRGNMLIKLLSLKTIADSRGPEMNQGTMLRYLAEMVWFPTAALNDYIKWEEVDVNSAKATMSYNGTTASGVFTFNENGEVTSFMAKRYGDFDGKYSLEDWLVPIKEYGEFEGIKVPTKGEIVWKLKTGDYNWFQWEITEMEYNKPEVY